MILSPFFVPFKNGLNTGLIARNVKTVTITAFQDFAGCGWRGGGGGRTPLWNQKVDVKTILKICSRNCMKLK